MSLSSLLNKVVDNYGYGESYAVEPYNFVMHGLERLSWKNKVTFLDRLIDPKGAGYLPIDLRDKLSKNKLQPSVAQCVVLKTFQNVFQFAELDLGTWLTRFENLSFFTRGSIKDADYDARADFIWKQWNDMCRNNDVNLVLMDGHGRIIYRLLKKIKEHGLEGKRRIIVVDMNPIVDRWHKLFLPIDHVESIRGDIFEIIKNMDNYLLYLNFCGFAGMVDNIMAIRGRYILSLSTLNINPDLKSIQRYIESKRQESVKLRYPNGEIGKLLKYLEKVEFENVSIREDFITIYVIAMECRKRKHNGNDVDDSIKRARYVE